MTGIIWYNKNPEAAEKKLMRIIGRYQCQISNIKKSRYSIYVVFENGDCWETRPANDSARGCKCNISYIEDTIPQEIINNVIRPITMGPPHQAIKTWHESDEEV